MTTPILAPPARAFPSGDAPDAAPQGLPQPQAAEVHGRPDCGQVFEPNPPHRFETEAAMQAEDQTRVRRLKRVVNRPGRTDWTNMADRLWLANQRSARVLSPPLDPGRLRSLAGRLRAGVDSGHPPQTLGSALHMRTLRQGLTLALLDALADYPDDDLRTVTVIYRGWRLTPAELERLTAAKLKNQFRTHLHRAGVLQLPGPLFAVLHGEFDPTSGMYQLHWHLVTTAAKAAALKVGLTATRVGGYSATATGAAPVRRSHVRDRARQLSYLAKSYWPSRPVIFKDGRWKRVRRIQRIPEPYGAQVLLWLDRQSLSDMIVTTGCWSRCKGGRPAMKALYSFVMRVGRDRAA